MASMRATPFGELLRRVRQAAELTQEELAERAGLSVRGINDLERGVRQTPRKDTVALLARALLLTGEERTAFEAAARHSHRQSAQATATTPQPAPIDGEAAAPSLPIGTVTFLFTDIEGSTRLLQQLGAARYAALRGIHHRLLRAACAAHGGREVDTAGDSFFFAFPTATEAVAVAAEAQHAFATEPWSQDIPVRVRMGLHTGAPLVASEGYVGLDVHRAARISACGHGGQVLLSDTTYMLVEQALPEGALLRDLGVHRLKDLQRSEHLWQLVLPDLPEAMGLSADFSPLDTLDAHPHNLPIQPTSLVGREREIAAVCALLQREDVRLMTLIGTGGTGKTRLALQVAAELVEAFADGVWFVRLSRLVDPELVLPTIAQTLGVREVGGQPIAVTLASYLHAKQVLIVLDNFEQVVRAAPAVAELLQTCAGLKVLVTSRMALHLRGEKQYRVRPLPLPDPAHLPPPQDLVQVPAVALFVQRAQDADETFALSNATVLAIVAICARLDGLPLAIELAAAKVRVLPPPALLARLERQLPLLVGGARDAEARQQTMRRTLAWSEDLLSPEEQRLFRRLAVFVGGFTLAAVEVVCAAPDGTEPLGVDVLEGLETLMDHNLVQQQTVGDEEGGGEARFRLLYIVREYALEQLDACGEAEAVRRAHAAYYLRLAEQAEPELQGPAQVAWLDRLERDHDNFRAVLAWARAHQHTETELGLRLAAALEPFWFARGHLGEGRGWTEGFLDVAAPHRTGAAGAQGEVSARVWARALKAACWLAHFGGADSSQTAARLEAAVATARSAGDLRTAAAALNGLAAVAYFQGDLARAAMRQEESLTLARAAGTLGDVANTLSHLGEIALHRGDLARATAFSEEALTLSRRAGELHAEANTLCILGQLALRGGDLTTAQTLHQQALALARTMGDPFRIADTLEYLVNAVGAAGHGEQAARLLGAAAALREAIGAPRPSVEQALNEQAMAGARAALGEERWAAAFAAGQAMTLEEAIAEALREQG
jgi:predicted ATPase/class 3 adenylate cyclase